MRISDWSSDVCSSDLVERCRVLLHLVDGTAEDVAGAYRTVRRELEAYGGGLPEKAEVVGLNKCDALSEESVAEKTAILKEMTASPILALRSEEHTSELQSLMRISYAVFCLTKKNNT